MAEKMSIGFMAEYRVLTRTWPGPGVGMGSSVTLGSAPALAKVTACILGGRSGSNGLVDGS